MEIVVGNVCLMLFLGISSLMDIRRREIPLVFLAGGLSGALAGFVFVRPVGLLSMMMGLGVGLCMIGISKVTRGQIGVGDGGVLCVTGVWLGFFPNMELLLGSLLLAAVWGIFLLCIRRAGRKTELPFIPFILLAYVVSGGVIQ